MEGVLFVYGMILMDGNDDYLEEIIDIMCVYVEKQVMRFRFINF